MINIKKVPYLTSALLVVINLLYVKIVLADFTFNAPTSITACDDFATTVLDDPWDMSNNEDVVNFTTNDLTFLSNASYANGLFNATSTLTAGGTFRLLSPRLPSTMPLGGKWGYNTPIDTAKYRSLTIRLGLDTLDEGQGLRFVWNRTTDYGKSNTFTNKITTRAGYANYTADFSTIGIDTSSDNTNNWGSGNIEGLGVLPTVLPQNFSVDYVRLEDPSSCGTESLSYNVSNTTTQNLHSIYIDDDTNPFNGYHKKIISAASATNNSTSLSALGLAPGTYKLIGIQDSDYATLVKDNPWDMNQSTDLLAVGEVSNLSFANGIASGKSTSSGGGPQFYLRLDGTTKPNLSTFNKLSLKLLPRTDIRLVWKVSGVSYSTNITAAGSDADQDGVYNVDLSAVANWGGNADEIIFIPAFANGVDFSFDFVHLRANGFVATDTLPSGSLGAVDLTIRDTPTLKIIQPDNKGQEAIRPWNFRNGDLAFSLNLDTSTDPTYTNESLSAFLPDVRKVMGLRGDFFKGTNIAGNDDPNDYLTFPQFTTTNNFTIDASQYKNLCLKMALDREYDLTLGSVTKLIYNREDGDIEELEAWGTIYDRWSSNKWYEFCTDLTVHPTEKGETGRWNGNIKYLRIDPHEFHKDSCCDSQGNPIGNPIKATYYYDYLKLRKDDSSHGKYTIVYDVNDNDSSNLTVSFFYNSTKSLSGGTLVPSSSLSCEGRVCLWDTTSVTPGSYYLYGTVTDGNSTNSSLASGRINIINDSGNTTTPILNLEAPSSNTTVCQNLQIKGYSLIQERYEDVSAIQVFVDGQYVKSLSPSLYSLKAISDYPQADSSNTGFDTTINISSLSAGTHSLTVKSYASDGGTSTKELSFIKSSGCQDPAQVVDQDPSGVPTTANLLDSSTGSGLQLTATMNEDASIIFTLTGTRNCNIARIGVNSKSSGDYTWIFGLTDKKVLDSNLISIKSTSVPKYLGTGPSSNTSKKQIVKLKKRLKKVSLECRSRKGKAKRKCNQSVKKIKKQIKELSNIANNPSTSVYFVTDCNQGETTSSAKTLDAKLFGNSDGAPCGNSSSLKFEDWFSCFATTMAQNTSLSS